MKNLLGLGLLCLLLAGCPQRTKEPVEQARLKAKLHTMETELETFDLKIHEAGNDPGLKNYLVNEKALLNSRVLRLRDVIQKNQQQ